MPRPSILASDLDGTFIPLPSESQNQADLRTLGDEVERADITLLYVTGRHYESAVSAIDEFQLPTPQWLICDVGTSLFQRHTNERFLPAQAYHDCLANIVEPLPKNELQRSLRDVKGLRLQEAEKQGPFKTSYYADASRLSELAERVEQVLSNLSAPYSLIQSVDPFTDDGLIDLLPRGVSKAFALAWWADFTDSAPRDIVFAGDSGNDVAALTTGYYAIVVGNADRKIASSVFSAHEAAGTTDCVHIAQSSATSGVLEGCRHFGLFGR